MFSSGMLMRVLFATATAFPADILLFDEWLSVVDEKFSAKAESRLKKLVSMAAIVIIASHDHGLLHRTCTSIIHLDRGRAVRTVRLDGEAAEHFELREQRA
jgi:lipopolysaccharide transport system ATP-binding protein